MYHREYRFSKVIYSVYAPQIIPSYLSHPRHAPDVSRFERKPRLCWLTPSLREVVLALTTEGRGRGVIYSECRLFLGGWSVSRVVVAFVCLAPFATFVALVEVGNGVSAEHRVQVVGDCTDRCPFVCSTDITHDAIDFGVFTVEAIDPNNLLFGKCSLVHELLSEATGELVLACVHRGEAIALLLQRCIVDAFPFFGHVSRGALRVALCVGAYSACLKTLVGRDFACVLVHNGSHWVPLSVGIPKSYQQGYRLAKSYLL